MSELLSNEALNSIVESITWGVIAVGGAGIGWEFLTTNFWEIMGWTVGGGATTAVGATVLPV